MPLVTVPENLMYLNNESVFAPIERAQQRQAEQNALARQQAVRNALAQSIDPRTGRTNWQQAYAMGGADVAPDLQGMQADEAQRITREDADYLKQKREQLEMYVNDQASYDAWVADVKTHHPYASFPSTFSPEVKDQLSGFSRRLELAGRTGTGFQTLTPEEEQQLGLPTGVVAQRGPKNDIKVVYKPNMPRAPSADTAAHTRACRCLRAPVRLRQTTYAPTPSYAPTRAYAYARASRCLVAMLAARVPMPTLPPVSRA